MPVRVVAPVRRRVGAAGLFLAVAANCTAAPTTRPAPLVTRAVSAGDVTGRVELVDSRDPAVRKHGDRSGVVISLNPLSGADDLSQDSNPLQAISGTTP